MNCNKCQKSFSCQGNHCWCGDFPPILKANDTHQNCLCPECLKKEIKNKVDRVIQNLKVEDIKSIQALGKPTKLIEGIDYTINERGQWVFSAWYLLRQGACCTNGCSNCPYPKKKLKAIKR